MVGRKGEQYSIDKHNVLKVVYHTLPIQEIHRRPKKVPVKRPCESKILSSARDVCNGNNFLEGNDLNRRDYCNDINMAGEHGNKEASDHYKRPYCPSNESLLFLLVLR